jgi:hypothetical protein
MRLSTVRENKALVVRWRRYVCDSPNHGHLTGQVFKIEPRMDALIDIADAARAANPDVFVMVLNTVSLLGPLRRHAPDPA